MRAAEGQGDAVGLLLHAVHLGAQEQGAVLSVEGGKTLADLGIFTFEELGAAVDEGDLGPQRGKEMP